MATVEQQLKGLAARVEKLEAAIMKKSTKPSPKKGNSDDNYKGATGGVRLLIDNGFFDKKKCDLGEVRKAAEGNGYHYSAQAVHDALKRLSAGASSPLVVLKVGGVKKYVRRK